MSPCLTLCTQVGGGGGGKRGGGGEEEATGEGRGERSQQTALDVILRPYGKADAGMLHEPLPQPPADPPLSFSIVVGNYAPTTALCLQQDMLAPHVLEAAGWEYVNEGTDAKPKKGYVSKTPGSVLKLKVGWVWDGGRRLRIEGTEL